MKDNQQFFPNYAKRFRSNVINLHPHSQKNAQLTN